MLGISWVPDTCYSLKWMSGANSSEPALRWMACDLCFDFMAKRKVCGWAIHGDRRPDGPDGLLKQPVSGKMTACSCLALVSAIPRCGLLLIWCPYMLFTHYCLTSLSHRVWKVYNEIPVHLLQLLHTSNDVHELLSLGFEFRQTNVIQSYIL